MRIDYTYIHSKVKTALHSGRFLMRRSCSNENSCHGQEIPGRFKAQQESLEGLTVLIVIQWSGRWHLFDEN